MLKRIFHIALSAMLLWGTAFCAQAADANDQATHEQLRALLHNVEQAVNTQQYGQLAQYFDPKMHVTPSNQETLSSPEQIKPYFDKWFGPGRFLKSVQMTMTADALTELNAAKDEGVVVGSGLEKYALSDGRHYDLPTRWTATVVKGQDGQWRMLTLHLGVDFTDNPLFNEVKAAVWRFAIYGAVAGLLVGLILGWLLTRRRRAA
jgi:ketosteroid isomerase-like protein